MTTVLTAEIDVEAPVREVYRQWARPESFPRYLGAVRSVRRIDDVRSRWTVEVGGQRDEFYTDVVEQAPDERVVWQSTDGVFHTGRVDLTDEGEHTHVRLRMVWEQHGIFDELGLALDVDADEAQRDLARFKRFVEDGAAERA